MEKAGVIHVVKTTVNEFIDDDCPALAAAIAYYTVLSLPPLLVLVITVAGFIWSPAEVERAIEAQIQGMMGSAAAEQVATMVASATATLSGGPWGLLIGLGTIIFAATTSIAQLQAALNRAWEVQPDPNSGGIKNFIMKRLLSFGLIVGIAFLLLVSMAFSALLTAFGGIVPAYLPLSGTVLHLLGVLVSFTLITLLFGAMFKVMPDADIAWRDVWTGAIFTAILFVIGKSLIGIYLGTSDPGSAYGAAGSLILILIWIYYSSMIVLLGAEFTQAWMTRDGRVIMPSQGAVKIIRQTTTTPREKAATGQSNNAEPDRDRERDSRLVQQPPPVIVTYGERTGATGLKKPAGALVGAAVLGFFIGRWR
jgi:membrane protein